MPKRAVADLKVHPFNSGTVYEAKQTLESLAKKGRLSLPLHELAWRPKRGFFGHLDRSMPIAHFRKKLIYA